MTDPWGPGRPLPGQGSRGVPAGERSAAPAALPQDGRLHGVGIGVDLGRRLAKVAVEVPDGVPVRGAPAEERTVAIPSGPVADPPAAVVDATCAAVRDHPPRPAGAASIVLAARPPTTTPGGAGRGVGPGDGAGDGAIDTVDLGRRLTDRCGVPVTTIDAALCLAAWLQPEELQGEGLVVVCDVGAHAVTAAVCVHDDAGLRLVEAERDDDAPAAAVAALEQALAHVARLAAGPGGAPAPVLAAEELGRHARRARLVLDRAAVDPTYLRTPVYFPGSAATLTAADVRRLLAPLGAAAAAVLSRLLERAGGPLPGAVLVLAGGYGPCEPVRTAVTAVAQASGVTRTHAAGLHATARGAARLAAGGVRLQVTIPRSLRLQGRRIRSGRLEPVDIDLARAGAAIPAVIRVEGEPLTVTVDAADVGAVLPLQVSDGPGRWRELSGTAPLAAPPGTYRLGLRPGRSPLGTLLLQPVEGGAPVTVPLPGVRRDEA